MKGLTLKNKNTIHAHGAQNYTSTDDDFFTFTYQVNSAMETNKQVGRKPFKHLIKPAARAAQKEQHRQHAESHSKSKAHQGKTGSASAERHSLSH